MTNIIELTRAAQGRGYTRSKVIERLEVIIGECCEYLDRQAQQGEYSDYDDKVKDTAQVLAAATTLLLGQSVESEEHQYAERQHRQRPGASREILRHATPAQRPRRWR